MFSSSQHPSFQRPGLHLRWRWGVIRAWILRPWILVRAAMSGTRCEIGARLSLQGRLRVRGPGRVIIEDDVIIGDGADLYTHHPDAVIRIGRGTFLNGTRISSALEVTIGAENIIGDARLLDTDFHWSHRDRHQDSRPVPAMAIRTGRNVWIGAATVLLKGSEVGENSVIAMGAIVSGRVPADEIWGPERARFLAKVAEPPKHSESPS